MPVTPKATAKDSTATFGFVVKLWRTADSWDSAEPAEGNRRNIMDAAKPSIARPNATSSPNGVKHRGTGQYKHAFVELIFLKYISDTFDEHHATLRAGKGDYA